MIAGMDQRIFGARDHTDRFEGEVARRILERAAVEQHRLDKELEEFYSLEELEEIAAEAGISRRALHAAIEDRPGWFEGLLRRMPGRWSLAVKRRVLIAGTGILLLAVMLVFPVVAKVIFWAAIIVLVMMALGVSPF